ncbi:MAG: DUF4185 domain-containing protein [Alphaproteobacteria bacterium]|nr:DUF4185 domain-containing protein [Alphaproteobacteria bacterium]
MSRLLLPASLLLACRPPGPVAISAEEIGVVAQSAAIEGRDGGGSARAFGRSVWTYGDTVLTVRDERDANWHHNSVSWTEDGNAADGVSGFVEPVDGVGAPRHLIPPSPSEQAYNDAHAGDACAETPCGARWAVWPGTPVWDPRRERALVFYGLIHAEPGELAFEGGGQSVAVWSALEEPPERPVVHAESAHPDLIWGPDDVPWGTAAVIEDDHVVALGCQLELLVHRCRLARAPAGRPTEPTAWRYWDGSAWGADPARAVVLFDGAPIVSLSWVDHLDAWLVVYSPPFDHDALARTAPALTGPWSAPSRLVTAPEDDPPYDVMHHPDLEEEGGRVQYLTWSRHTTGWFGTEFPLVRVVLE